MARITVEDCLEKEHNRFALVILIAKRAKQLLTGGRPTIENRQENKSVVLAAREVAEGTVHFGDIVPLSTPDSLHGENGESTSEHLQGQVA